MTRPRAFQTKIISAISLLLFACLLLPAVAWFGIGASRIDRDLVYCPLQKIWVKRASAVVKTRINVFEQICATREVETNIFQNVFARLSALQVVADADTAEDLIFDYLRHGDSAVKLYGGSPLPSPEQSAELIAAKAVLGVSQNPLDGLCPTTVCPQLCPRPPTAGAQTFISDRSGLFRRSDDCTPNLLPRPPPVLS